MENVQNKDVKVGEGHGCEGHSSSCHCMMCSWKGGGWHGHHSIVRIAIAVAVIVGAFCAGAHASHFGGHDRHDRGGYGHGRFERHFEGYGRGQNVRFYGETGMVQPQPGMMTGGQVILKSAMIPATGTKMMMQN